MTSRTVLRTAQGDAAVYSPREAAALLPGRDEDELRWLRAEGLVREKTYPDGRTAEYVLWSEVHRALDASRPELPAQRGRVVVGLRRRSV